jgi:hypothetical protein
MSRTLTSAMQTAISAKEGYADVWFLEIASGNADGTAATTLRYATAPSDVSWNSQTWVGIGGAIEFDPPPETSDSSGQSLRLSLSGVDTGLVSQVLGYYLRGRTFVLYWGQITISSGTVVADPIEAFSGLANATWEIAQTPSNEGTRGTVRISTTIVSQMARYVERRMVRTSVDSLRLMQARSSRDIFDESTPDVFFATLPAISGKPVYWGRVGARQVVQSRYVEHLPYDE